MIEGDLVTHPLRRRFQLRFGGRGIGFIPVTSPQPGFRTTINHHFNDVWETYSFNHSGLSKGYYPGFSGYVFRASENAHVSYSSEAGYGLFRNVTILYRGDKETRLNLKTDTTSRELILPSGENISAFPIRSDSAFGKLSLTVLNGSGGLLYGAIFEDGPGVYIDNYAFRGNSGLPLRQIPSGTFSRLSELLNNKLIILHFGLNVFTPGVSDYHWYEEAISGVISHVKAASPGAGILVISMPDRAALIGGAYYTPAELPDFIRLQQRVAEKNQVAFFSLFDAMGGVNSMKSWVEQSPRLAGDDYTHPNSAGAGRVASLIFQYLMAGYDRYLENQSQQIPQPIKLP
jgi:lysophospholipase L1-like esterase